MTPDEQRTIGQKDRVRSLVADALQSKDDGDALGLRDSLQLMHERATELNDIRCPRHRRFYKRFAKVSRVGAWVVQLRLSALNRSRAFFWITVAWTTVLFLVLVVYASVGRWCDKSFFPCRCPDSEAVRRGPVE
jgi:hypothetical protein